LANIDESNKIYTKVVSPNFELKYFSSIEDVKNKLEKLIKYSDPDPQKKTLFVWPEGVFTGFNFEQIKQYKSEFEEAFSENHLILFGINTLSSVKSKNNIFNSLIIVNNKLDIIFQYNKIKLVPFGEFLPFEAFLNKFGLKTQKLPQYKIAEQLDQYYIKLYNQYNNDNIQLMLKISGIWENQKHYGLTYKFYPSVV
jgi:apolipoprotein N-acyltransferase